MPESLNLDMLRPQSPACGSSGPMCAVCRSNPPKRAKLRRLSITSIRSALFDFRDGPRWLLSPRLHITAERSDPYALLSKPVGRTASRRARSNRPLAEYLGNAQAPSGTGYWPFASFVVQENQVFRRVRLPQRQVPRKSCHMSSLIAVIKRPQEVPDL